ncbi:MAG TPA: hypothetical protein VGC06_26790 [Actinomycetes bacterium]
MADDMDQLRAEQERILIMPGAAAMIRLRRLGRTLRVFHGNADALLAHLRQMDDLGRMLTTTTNPEALEEFGAETERHLHNFVAAAQSRVDHFRQFARAEWPEDSPSRQEYERRVEQEFRTSPLHNFIIKLRQLMQHVRLPLSTSQETWTRGDPWTVNFRVMLDSADLLRWPDWNLLARSYIQASGKAIDLAQTVITYSNEILAFDQWIAERFTHEHQEEIESYLEAATKVRERLRQLGLLNPQGLRSW